MIPLIPNMPMVMTDDPDSLTGDTLSIDFETYYSKDYTLRRMDHRTYCTDDRFDAYVMSVYDGERCWVGHPKDFPWSITTGKTIVSFNACFDMACYLFGLDAPCSRCEDSRMNIPPFKEWLCSKAAANYLGIYGTLADMIKKIFGITVSKEVREKAKGIDFSKLDELPEDMKEYVAGDSYYCHALWQKFSKFWPQHERDCWRNTVAMAYRGIPSNKQFLIDGLDTLEVAREKYADAIPMVKKLSIPQLKQACIDAGVPPPETTAKSSQKFTDWLMEYGDYVPWVADITKYRSANRLIAIGTAMRDRMYTDAQGIHRIPYLLTYCGASTGRWTGGGDGVNVQQFNRNVVEGFNFRNVLQAPKGYKLVVADYAGIEARLVAWVCGQEGICSRLANGEKDIYLAYAQSWGLVSQDVTDFKAWCHENNPNLRMNVKAGALACGFKCSWSAIQRSNPGLPKEQCQAIVDMYRSNSPEVVAWWDTLDKQAEAGMRTPSKSFALTLPSGRKLYYRNMYRKLVQPRDGRKPYWAIAVDFGSKCSIVNTNLLSNNFIQGTARDLMMNTFNRACTELPAEVVNIVHDEIILLVKDENVDTVVAKIKDIMENPPEWAKGLPLLAEPDVLQYYTKD